MVTSKNPKQQWKKLEDLPQEHFVGAKDNIIPLDLTQSFASVFPEDKKPIITVIDNFDHACCWSKFWKRNSKSIIKHLK